MNTVTKLEFKKNIIAFFTKESGMTITAAKEAIRKTLLIDKYGNATGSSIKAGNVKLFYCNNSNYCGGLKNGYGKGWYISNGGFTGGSTIKLQAKL